MLQSKSDIQHALVGRHGPRFVGAIDGVREAQTGETPTIVVYAGVEVPADPTLPFVAASDSGCTPYRFAVVASAPRVRSNSMSAASS